MSWESGEGERAGRGPPTPSLPGEGNSWGKAKGATCLHVDKPGLLPSISMQKKNLGKGGGLPCLVLLHPLQMDPFQAFGGGIEKTPRSFSQWS